MIDPKRLIESMELCKSAERDCHKCMYCETENDCRDSMIYDAVELLKEKEPVKPELYLVGQPEYKFYRCPVCKVAWYYKGNYCMNCGRAVKWDAAD